MLRHHRDRLYEAAKDLGWAEACNILEGRRGLDRLKVVLQDNLPNMLDGSQHLYPQKLRVLINSHGHFSVTSTALPPLPLSSLSSSHFPAVLSQLPPAIDYPNPEMGWRIFLSPVPVSPSLFTRHKTTERSIYDEARLFLPESQANVNHPSQPLDEVLIINHDDEVMEGSITTPYFWRGGRWVTPTASSGGNLGTTRRYALDAGLCIEKTIMKDSIADGEAIWLSNGARGWGWGKIMIQNTHVPGT
ncbi:MAG: hypothetical protein Q9211_002332 [Gyalolechia sp. 1 TL-2023]